MKNFSPQIDLNFGWELRKLCEKNGWSKDGKIIIHDQKNQFDILRDSFTKEKGGMIPRKEWEKDPMVYDEYLHEVLKMLYLKVVASAALNNPVINKITLLEPQVFNYTWKDDNYLHYRNLKIHRGLLKGRVFVITGKLKWWTRKDYEAIITYLGGKVEKKINSRVTHLIEGDLSSKGGDSLKMKNAREFGTSIMSEKEFRELI